VEARGEVLHVEAPRGALSPELVRSLRRLKPALLRLVLFEDPLICANTSVSDFRGEDLIGGDQPVLVYLTVAPSDLDRMRPLLRIVLNKE
jgi:hypothetical protein